mmetsp:Transcript_23092/g.75160  ORF Transcript_23092/g.75160 Transcript_23092/m.75160 type:complete len:203 (-) Transcript_23092:2617-3225(-)
MTYLLPCFLKLPASSLHSRRAGVLLLPPIYNPGPQVPPHRRAPLQLVISVPSPWERPEPSLLLLIPCPLLHADLPYLLHGLHPEEDASLICAGTHSEDAGPLDEALHLREPQGPVAALHHHQLVVLELVRRRHLVVHTLLPRRRDRLAHPLPARGIPDVLGRLRPRHGEELRPLLDRGVLLRELMQEAVVDGEKDLFGHLIA